MGVELRPMGVHCNIACQYCYQNPLREAGNVSVSYDLEKMKRAIEDEGGPFTIFGGEPLLLPIEDLENLFSWGFKKFGQNQIQTNGTILSPEHIALFKRYNVKVGVSVDGPGELNDVRWVNNLDRTREMSAKTHDTIWTLCANHLAPSIIITLHRVNGSQSAWAKMNAWIRELEMQGVRIVRLHVLEVDDPDVGAKYQLTQQEQIACFRNFAQLERDDLSSLQFDIFNEVRDLLVADDFDAGCVWHACDPMTTKAVRGVEGLGQRSNCGRTNKDGIEYVKSPTEGFERYRALYSTPIAEGGCQGCRFFLVCKGQCPGTAIDADWRNRSESCGLWTALFVEAEAALLQEGRVPLSLHEDRKILERMLLGYWARGQNPSLRHLVNRFEQGERPTSDEEAKRFFRFSWTSARAREVWEARFLAIRGALIGTAFLAVREGLLTGYRTTTALRDYPDVATICDRLRITFDRTDIVAKPGERPSLRDPNALDLLQIDLSLGSDVPTPQPFEEMLFELASLVNVTVKSGVQTLHGDWTENPFWSVLGLDPSFAGALDLAGLSTNNILTLARTNGFAEEINWLSEVLSWPVEWTAKSGIAEFRTPVIKVIHNAPFVPVERRMRWQGELLPMEAAQGHAHPFRQPKRRVISGSTTFRRGLATIEVPEF